jgi:starvation-inducible DNA-binding protein
MSKLISNAEKADLQRARRAVLATPTDLSNKAVRDVSGAMNGVLADVFALYVKTKNFHWHMSGPHFRDYHLLLDEQATQIFDMTDEIAERVRKIGGQTIKSIGQIAQLKHILDNDGDYVEPSDMLAELGEDNKGLLVRLRAAHVICDEHDDYATTSLIENWIDETERRIWFLFESGGRADSGGH